MLRKHMLFIIVAFILTANFNVANAANDSKFDDMLSKNNYAPNEILIKINPSASIYTSVSKNEIAGVENIIRGKKKERVKTASDKAVLKRLYISKNADMKQVMKKLSNNGDIISIEVNYKIELLDTYTAGSNTYSNQYYLDRCSIPQAWEVLEQNGAGRYGSENVTVAMVDTGIDKTHPALCNSLWTNLGEIAGDGKDNDGNGYIDDINGYNFGDDNNNINDIKGHGTKTSGIIAADNVGGMQGIASDVKIMMLRIFNSAGEAYVADLIEALEYAADNGADVINMSLSGLDSLMLREAIDRANDTSILVAAAGNGGKPNEEVNGYTAGLTYPAVYESVLGVMSEDYNFGYVSGFSNWDANPGNSIEYEVIAPGGSIYTTLNGGGYDSASGTSFAAPVVSGIMALLRSLYPDKSLYSNQDLINMFLNNCSNRNFRLYSSSQIIQSYKAANAFKSVTSSSFKAGNIMVYNSGNIETCEILGGNTINIGQFISNPANENINAALIAAVYDNNKMEQIKVFNEIIAANQNSNLNEEILINEGLKSPRLKVILWDNLNSLIPLSVYNEQ